MSAGIAGGGAVIRVWDLPTRLMHWALAVLVVFSYTTGMIGDTWMPWHLRSGYAILALLVFRLAWGFAGSDTSRFAAFLRGPSAAMAYLRALRAPHGPFIPGHNPLGGWMVMAMLAILAVQATSGLFADNEIDTQGPLAVKVSNALVSRMSALHGINSWVVVGVVALHVTAIAVYALGLRTNLVTPMVTGSKHVANAGPGPAPRLASNARAAVLFAASAIFVYALVVVYPKA
jgi:cytochrome b